MSNTQGVVQGVVAHSFGPGAHDTEVFDKLKTNSPVILWKKIDQPATNCNRRFFNGFRLCNVSLITYQKSQKIPLREVTKKRDLL